MVETSLAHRSCIRKSTLHLVSDGQCSQQLATRTASHLRGGKHWSQIVAWMACLTTCQVAVVEIQVAHQKAVPKGCTVRCGTPHADERAHLRATKSVNMLDSETLSHRWIDGRRSDKSAKEEPRHRSCSALSRRCSVQATPMRAVPSAELPPCGRRPRHNEATHNANFPAICRPFPVFVACLPLYANRYEQLPL